MSFKDKEKSHASKRVRSDRVKVICTHPLKNGPCNQLINKDSVANHYATKHNIFRKELHRYKEALPDSQTTLDFKKGTAQPKLIMSKNLTTSDNTLQKKPAASLVSGEKNKPKPNPFFGLPKTSKTSGKSTSLLDLKKPSDKKIDESLGQDTSSPIEGEAKKLDRNLITLLCTFEESKVISVLNELAKAASEEEKLKIIKPWKSELEKFREYSVQLTPILWSSHIEASYKDTTLPTELKNTIGVAKTGAGGDCQFKGISLSLYGTEELHTGLRLLLANELMEMKDVIEPIAKNAFTEESCEKIFQRVIAHGCSKGWGNETTKYIMSKILQRPIIVTSTNVCDPKTAWVECRHVRYNADPAALRRDPIHLLLNFSHYDAILKKGKGQTFVNIEKCQNLHPRLSKGYEYVEFSTEDETLTSNEILTQWKKATQMEEFEQLQILKYEHLADQKYSESAIQQILDEDRKNFLDHFSENVADVAKGTGMVQSSLPNQADTSKMEGSIAAKNVLNVEKLFSSEVEDMTGMVSSSKRTRSEPSSSSSAMPEEYVCVSPTKSEIHSLREKSQQHDKDVTILADDETEGKLTLDPELVGSMLKELKTELAEVRMFMQQLVLNPIQQSETKKSATRAVELNLDSVNSIEALKLACPWLTYYKEDTADENEEFSGLRCILCFNSASSRKEGQFGYSSKLGKDFGNQSHPQKFRNLKNNVKVHTLNDRHREMAALQKANTKLTLLQRQQKTGMILGSLAYESIKNDHSYESYEGKVAAAANRGEDVGMLNHSSDYCSKFSDSVFKTIQEKLKTKLEQTIPGTSRRTSYSIAADKYTATETRSAGQIVGAVAFIDGKIVDVMLEDKMVTNWRGESLAKDIISSVEAYIPVEIQKQRCVGGCFDGQYLHDGVHRHLMKNLPGDEEDKSKWYSFEWDPAHLIENAILDAKKVLKKTGYLPKIHSIVHDFNIRFTSGKAYIEMLQTAEEHQQRLYAPIQSSPTRFANNEYKKLLNFSRNYNLIRDKFADDDSIQDIEHFQFVAGLTFQIDLYNEIAKLSGNVQQAGKPGWRIDSNVVQTLTSIKEMVESLPDADTLTFKLSPKLPNLADAVTEMQNNTSYKGVGVIFKKIPTRQSRGSAETSPQNPDIPTVLSTIKKDARSFVTSFEAGYYERKQKFKASASAFTANLAEAAFSLDNMVTNSEKKIVPKEFMEYYYLSKRVGFTTTELTDPEVEHQYRTMTFLVKEEYDKAIAIRGALTENQEVLEKQIYQYILNTEHENEMDVAADLYLSALLRTRAESIAESMGSIVKAVSHSRPNLPFEKLSQDAFICYNGPETYAADTQYLIEEATNRHFRDNTQSDEWHFHRKTVELTKLASWKISKTVDNKKKEASAKAKMSYK